MRVLPYGDTAVLIDVDDNAQALHLAAALANVAGITELVPAARTVLARFDASTDLQRVADAAERIDLSTAPSMRAADEVTIRVHYDGADLAAVADETGLGVDEVVRRHTAGDYTVAFCGFSPGFAYLLGLDETLRLPRLAEPRTSVPAGSVAIAGEFTGVYPSASPGGWRLLGRTDAVLWDTARTPPALLPPGTRVRFVAGS
jgi:5-oxoprolinase (ATP-hydrolysing) subunit B